MYTLKVSDIARVCRVSKEAAYVWFRRGPHPVHHAGSTPARYGLADVFVRLRQRREGCEGSLLERLLMADLEARQAKGVAAFPDLGPNQEIRGRAVLDCLTPAELQRFGALKSAIRYATLRLWWTSATVSESDLVASILLNPISLGFILGATAELSADDPKQMGMFGDAFCLHYLNTDPQPFEYAQKAA